jgi:hypothetical protein
VGPTLDLVRGQPVRITIVNRLPEATAVHWHGIELESYFDGVPGFSGAGQRVAPLIAPGDSFQVRFTPPRAGTFIYHTHADEERQQLAGLAGALVVSEPGERRDSTIDIPILLTAPTDFAEQGRIALVNGSAAPGPIDMKVGTTYRLRLIQMSASRAALRVNFGATAHTLRGARWPRTGRIFPRPSARRGRGGRSWASAKPSTSKSRRRRPATCGWRCVMGPPWPAPSELMTTLPIRVALPESPPR